MATQPVFGTAGYLPWDTTSYFDGGETPVAHGPAERFGIFDIGGRFPDIAFSPENFSTETNTGGESESTITRAIHALALGDPRGKALLSQYFPSFANDPLNFIYQTGVDPRTGNPLPNSIYDPTYGYLGVQRKNPDKGLLGAAMPALTFAGLAAGLGGLSGLLGSGAAATGGLGGLTPVGFEMGLPASSLPGYAGAAGAVGTAANGGNMFGLGDFGFLDDPLGGLDLSSFGGDFSTAGFSTPAEFLTSVGPGTGDLYGAYDLLNVPTASLSPGIWDSTKSLVQNLTKVLGGSGSGGSGNDSLLSLLGKAAPAAFGAYASNQQSNALERLAKDYMGMGAPYREKLAGLYSDPNAFLSSKEVQVPIQQGTDIMARSLSTNGNPAGSGNALQRLQSYASDQLFGRLGQEKDRLAGFGGLANYNAAAPQASSNAIGSQANMYNAIGAGFSDVFNPKKTLAQQLYDLNQLNQQIGY